MGIAGGGGLRILCIAHGAPGPGTQEAMTRGEGRKHTVLYGYG